MPPKFELDVLACLGLPARVKRRQQESGPRGFSSEIVHDRLKNGQYRAQPLRRVYIPKEDGRQRPISIPSLEDKIVQKALINRVKQINRGSAGI